jgi:hypothetical protein
MYSVLVSQIVPRAQIGQSVDEPVGEDRENQDDEESQDDEEEAGGDS